MPRDGDDVELHRDQPERDRPHGRRSKRDVLGNTSTCPEGLHEVRGLMEAGYIDMPVRWMLEVLKLGIGPTRVALCLLFQGSMQKARGHTGADFTVTVANSIFELWGVPRTKVSREVAKLKGLVEVEEAGTWTAPTRYRVLVAQHWIDVKKQEGPDMSPTEGVR